MGNQLPKEISLDEDSTLHNTWKMIGHIKTETLRVGTSYEHKLKEMTTFSLRVIDTYTHGQVPAGLDAPDAPTAAYMPSGARHGSGDARQFPMPNHVPPSGHRNHPGLPPCQSSDALLASAWVDVYVVFQDTSFWRGPHDIRRSTKTSCMAQKHGSFSRCISGNQP
jgi:hypothetical protein